jgi:hypothetical protein
MIECREGSHLAARNPQYDTHQMQGEVAVEIVNKEMKLNGLLRFFL